MIRKGLTFLALTALLASPAFAISPDGPSGRMSPAQRRALDVLPQDVNIVLDEQDVPGFLMGHLSARTELDPVAEATSALRRHGAAFRVGPDDAFSYRVHESDAVGQTHVRMSQMYKGLRVVGGELIVHMTNSQVRGINGRFVADLDIDVAAGLTSQQAIGAAASFVGQEGQVLDVAEVRSAVIFEGRVAFPVKMVYTANEALQMDDVFVDAQTGDVLGRHPRMYTAKNRAIYNMNQACISTGNELPGTLMFSEGGSSADTGAMGAYNGSGTTYDFYFSVFGRDSYNGSGAQMKSSVHGQFSTGTSCTKNNAAWFGSPFNQMVYGDGDGTTFTNLANGLDVTAHELTHAVCEYSADLVYQKESGALNEANSDILGEATAFYAGQGDWKIGAEIYTPGTAGDALRYMANPTQDGYSADYYPERLYSGTCTPSNSNDQCGVHGNSGIANLFFYLLSQGGTHPRGKTTVSVTGIGITSARSIWYRALTSYMTSSTNFQGARTATASAAADLFGGSCSTTWQAVHKAWDAVGVPGTWSCGTTYSIAGNAGTSGVTVSAGSASATSDASGNYTITGLAAGTYTVTPSKSGCTFSPTSQSVTVGPNATGKNFTASCPSGDTPLTSGVGVAGSVAASAWKYYYITVPAGATNLVVATTGATGDVDLYTRSGSKPTSTTYNCRPYSSSGNETCTQASPTAGTWWFGVNGYAAGSYTITATVTTSAPTYSISGNAGTTGATVTAGSASATSDASSNYTISGLAAGTYTVTPSKTGCTFSPTSQSVTVGPNATGKNFTASCGGGGTPTERITNGGFETLTASTNTAADGSWTRTAYTGTSFNTLVANGAYPHGGTDYGYVGVSNSSSQTVDSKSMTIGSGATSSTLSFWVSIVTSESGSTVYDTLQVQIIDAGTNAVLSTVATLSNVDKTAGAGSYVQKSYNVNAAVKGKNVKVRFKATSDSSLVTTFRIDDVSLMSN